MKKIFAIIALAFGIITVMEAQTAIKNEKLAQDGKQVTVTFDVDTDETQLPNQRKEVILPYIYNEADTLWLESLEVYGKGRYKRERQEKAIAGDKTWELAGNQIIRKEGVYKYESQVPLKKWMTTANLGIRRQIIGCACENDLADENIAQESLFEVPQVVRRLPSYTPAEVSRKWDMGQDEMEIIFKVSKAQIDSSVFNNEVTFGKILAAVDKIHKNPLYRIEKLHVAGYASPEGPLGFNKTLGINRANALINYIIEHRPEYGLTKANFEIHNGEENWEGLRRVLSESAIEEKDEVIAVIDNVDISSEAKKRQIKSMDRGRVWNRMLKEIYPHLRCARCLAVYYDASDDVLVEVINKVNQLMAEEKYQEAYDLAIQHKDDPRATGAIGTCLMMQKKFEEAMPWLQKALEGGCTSAQKNIEAIQAEYEWEDQQRKEIEEYLKKYE